MKRIISTVIFVFFFIGANAQQIGSLSGRYKITGRVSDAASNAALEYASIALVDLSSQKTINGSITDKNGNFGILKIPQGNYTIKLKVIGYADSSIKVVINGDLSLGNISLAKKSTTLRNVTVTSTQRAIENRIDKLVYNVDKDITSLGGVATDALKKIPMVSVDADGNVELLGNPSILFLINGKPSGIFANSAADALQSIPNSQIQSIEVITSPSARYDASGTGGIINIVLKKSKMQGMNGNINLSAGTRLENSSLNLAWKNNNFGLNAFGSGNAQLNALTPTGSDRLTNLAGGNNRLIQQSEINFNRNGYKSGLGFDWNIAKNDNLTGTMGYNHFGNNNNGNINQELIKYDASGGIFSSVKNIRVFDNQVHVTDFDNSLVFKHQFKKENQELEIGYNGSYSQNHTFYDQTQRDKTTNIPFSGATSLNPGKENETEFSVDYVQPLTKKFTLETGYKTGFQSIISNADVFTLNPATGNYLQDPAQSYASSYYRTIYAGYISSTFSLLNFLDIKAGLRYEYTVSHASYSNSGKVGIPDYHNLAPSFVIAHTSANKQTIKFAYSYRIERPDYRDLNPFMNLSDPHNITTGNPNLQPEIGHNYELGYIQTFSNGAYINLVLNFQRNSPDIKSYISYYPSYKIGDSIFTDVTVTTRANISAEERSGLNISVSLPFNKKLTIRPNIMVFNRHLNNIYANPPITDGFGFRTNINATYLFNREWTAEVYGNYNLGMHWQGRQPSIYSYTLAAKKQFFQAKGSLGIVLVNIFNHYIHQTSRQENQDFISNNYRDLPYRSVGISFSYRFGKMKFSKVKEGDNYLYTPPGEN